MLIEQRRVRVNGKLLELGAKVADGDRVTVDNQLIKPIAENNKDRIYIAYHKPVGITCTTQRSVKGNIIDAIGFKQRIFPIGRLDKPSEGLILLTNDGDIVNKILRAENAHSKVYRVTVNKPITPSFIHRMANGIPILDTVTLKCKVTQLSKHVFEITLRQGLNRQIRRMCEHLDYDVTKLIRTRIMHIKLNGIAPGKYRHLTAQEMAIMNLQLQDSSKTYDQSTNAK